MGTLDVEIILTVDSSPECLGYNGLLAQMLELLLYFNILDTSDIQTNGSINILIKIFS